MRKGEKFRVLFLGHCVVECKSVFHREREPASQLSFIAGSKVNCEVKCAVAL